MNGREEMLALMQRKKNIWVLSCLALLVVPVWGGRGMSGGMADFESGEADFRMNRTDSVLVLAEDTADVVLGEVTVKARSVWRKDDRRLILPPAELVKKSTDGMDLLCRLRLPRISVNQLTGAVGVSSGEDVVLCINGVKVSSAEISAVPPEDILRIEFHDSPGARYGNAGAVIDYITKRHEMGGNVNGDFFNGIGKEGLSAIDDFSARFSSGRSEWSVGAQYMQVKRDDWVRDYMETRVLPTGEVNRNEVGAPVPMDLRNLNTFLNYSYMRSGRFFFNARLNYAWDDVPCSEEGDRRNLLYASDMEAPLAIYEHMTKRIHSPALDLYAQYTLEDGGKLIFDVVGTYIKTASTRLYQERRDDALVSDVFSDIAGDKYSLIAEGIYEKRFGTHSVTGGVRHTQAYMDNVYSGTTVADVALHQSETSIYAEYGQHIGKWGYIANLTGSRLYYSQRDVCSEKYALQPSVRISFDPNEHAYLKYRVGMRADAPSLSAMNDAVQAIDAGMVRKGNIGLKSFHTVEQTLTAGYEWTFLSVNLALGYKYEFNPIMESVLYDGGIFVRTYENQHSFRHLSAEANVTVRPWKDYITLVLTPEVSRYVSRGNLYRHTYMMPRLRWELELAYRNWSLAYYTLVGYANYVYGEQLMAEKNMHTVMLGCRQPKWALQFGLLNPFLKEYWMDTRGWADLAPSVSRAHSDHPLQFMVKLNFNLNYGRSAQRERKRIHNEDRDAGIMQGTKK